MLAMDDVILTANRLMDVHLLMCFTVGKTENYFRPGCISGIECMLVAQ